MRAIVLEGYGGVEHLVERDVPVPAATAGYVVVKVEAVALNRLDIWIRQGMPKAPTLPHVLGADIAGVVFEVGPGVGSWQAGDRVVIQPGVSCGLCVACISGLDNRCPEYKVLGEGVSGGYCEYISVPAVNLLQRGDRLSPFEASALPLTLLTAWTMVVRRAEARLGDVVLVQAAGSGVGSMAIQVAKALGCYVLATAGSDEKLGRAQQLGADGVVNYSEQDVATEVRRLTDNRGADVVIEHVGAATLPGSMKSLARDGRLVTCGVTTGGKFELNVAELFWKRQSFIGSRMGVKGDLASAWRFVESGQVVPVVDRVFPMEEARAAHEYLEERRQFGKVVLDINCAGGAN